MLPLGLVGLHTFGHVPLQQALRVDRCVMAAVGANMEHVHEECQLAKPLARQSRDVAHGWRARLGERPVGEGVRCSFPACEEG